MIETHLLITDSGTGVGTETTSTVGMLDGTHVFGIITTDG